MNERRSGTKVDGEEDGGSEEGGVGGQRRFMSRRAVWSSGWLAAGHVDRVDHGQALSTGGRRGEWPSEAKREP